MKQQNEKQRTNKPSTLLSQDENDLLFSLLGRRCQVCEAMHHLSIFSNDKCEKIQATRWTFMC